MRSYAAVADRSCREDPANPFSRLPAELTLGIFSYLSEFDLGKTYQVPSPSRFIVSRR